ncbi:DNA-binding transcriptional regulator AraC [Roseovarius albus]|uniref:DNA-binding transcriptional regulator AraC n=1 Tax=Roseovarius albus TaxID=1247867 RepID=A0A1X7A546_9RHOB|nr:AraC family transcriptional regulator [Roseovarius albus]SLN70613.1 DNA-binding transcriptional regulator AraC [Roseovarius albus]
MNQRQSNEELILIKASQVWPFMDVVSRLGGNIEDLAERAGLPLDAVLEKKGVIGERSAWRFAGFAAQSLGNEHLGYLVATEHPVHSVGELGGMRVRMAPTIGKLLQFFIEDVTYENNGAKYSLIRHGDHVVFRREIMFPDCIGRWQTEQYIVTILVQIIRLCAENSWQPSWLGLASSAKPLSIPSGWSGIDIKWGNPATEIAMDESLLHRQVSSAIQLLAKHHGREPSRPITSGEIDYIVDRQLWSGGTSIAETAHELGVSSSTLKRRLKRDNRTYSGIVGERRQYWAERLLVETDTPLAQIARTLGYTHLPNFTRAFKARTGLTPSGFRANQRSNSNASD